MITPEQVQEMYLACKNKTAFLATFDTTSFFTVSTKMLERMYNYLKR